MIIHSTILDTQDKVIAFYGGTTWISHSGYFLRGASSGVAANSAAKTGGNDDLITPYHNHTFTGTTQNHTSGGMSANASHNHSSNATTDNGFALFNTSDRQSTGVGFYARTLGGNYYAGYSATTNSKNLDHKHTTSVTPKGTIGYAGSSGNATNANIPNYKSVYIWERTA